MENSSFKNRIIKSSQTQKRLKSFDLVKYTKSKQKKEEKQVINKSVSTGSYLTRKGHVCTADIVQPASPWRSRAATAMSKKRQSKQGGQDSDRVFEERKGSPLSR